MTDRPLLMHDTIRIHLLIIFGRKCHNSHCVNTEVELGKVSVIFEQFKEYVRGGNNKLDELQTDILLSVKMSLR